MKKAGVAIALIACAAPAWAFQQPSLAEIAKKQKKARSGQTKVITEAELKNAKARIDVAPVDASAAESPKADAGKPEVAKDGAPDKPTEKTEDELQAEARKAWQDRVKETTDEVTRLNTEVTQLQTALNDRSQQMYGSARTRQLQQLDAAKAKLTGAQQRAADLDEEGRRQRFR